MPETKRPIALCAMVPYPLDTTPSQRFRIEQWRPHLAHDGIQTDLVAFADHRLAGLLYEPGRPVAKALALSAAFVRRLIAVLRSRVYDVVCVHRGLSLVGPALLERLLWMGRAPILYDFDDAIFLRHTAEANRRVGWLKFPGKTAAICRMSSHVVVGNAWLAEYARRHNPRVSIVPTSIDTDVYRPRAAVRSRKPIIGWSGSATSQVNFEQFARVLGRLLARRDVEIRVVSNRQPNVPGLPLEWRRWIPETEVDEIGQFDVGIMPLPDEPWSQGKCSLKALQYMALGVATIASDVGANRDVIQHDGNGLLARSEDDWLTLLEGLVDQPALRERLGAAGRRTVEQRFSMRRSAAEFAAVVRSEIDRAMKISAG